jgi:nicotinamidase-related amidase
MSKRIWDDFLTERDKAFYAASGLGARGGFGKRPALLVVDVSYTFCGEGPEPILESIKKWRGSCGEEAWAAIEFIKPLLAKAREKGLPVIYSTNGFRKDLWDLASWTWKNTRSVERPRVAVSNRDGHEIVEAVAPGPQDIVVYKQKPSAFYGTGLASYLTLLGCDSVIVAGCATSGCVRATVIDAFNLNYRVALPEETCFDTTQASHAINLYDMNAKYADVVPTTDVLAFFESLPAGQFVLPKGAHVSMPDLMPVAANI